ncbi:MAG: hypothetical protein JW840_02920 [Candidatus Thermoplasmatota archaeon]|nr:hypothetical protein [Candidatus Thermoplasmatota archaeon]
MLSLKYLVCMPPQSWFLIGVMFLVLAVLPGILFAVLGIGALLLGFMSITTRNKTRSQVL